MTRVLHVIPNMGGGGAERELTHLAGALKRLGADVHVALRPEGPNFERLARSGADIHPIVVAGNYNPRLVLSIDRIIRGVRPDLVQTWLTQMDVAAGWVANRRRLPWIVAERSSAMSYRRTLKGRLRVAVARGAVLIQANSIEGTRYWQSVLPDSRTRFIPSPVPVGDIESVPTAGLAAAGRRDGVPLILFAGRFNEQKNLPVLIEALALVLRSRPACAALCGQGPQGKDVLRWLSERGIADRVALPGYVDNIWGWMKAADAFVSVSHFEGRPNTVVEAAAARCPLVVSDIPEHREFLQAGVHALIVDRHSPEAVAVALREVLDDRDAAARRADAAHRVVAEWTVDRIAAVHIEMYEDAVRYHAQAARSVQ